MKRFWMWLWAIGGAGLALRLLNVLAWRPTVAACTTTDGCYQVNGDALYSYLQGDLFARRHGLAASAVFAQYGEIAQGAGDPPIYPLFLGWVSAVHGSGGLAAQVGAVAALVLAVAAAYLVVRRVWGETAGRRALQVSGGLGALLLAASVVPFADGTQLVGAAEIPVDLGAVTAHRLASCVVGSTAIVLVGLLGRQLADDRVGLTAAALAAINPMLWINDGMLLSESLYVPLCVLAALAGYAFWNRPSGRRAVAMGLFVALAALTRAEAVLLFVLMVIPLAWGVRDEFRRRAQFVLLAGAAGAALLLPWFAFNLVRFEEPTLMTSGTGAVLSAGSCDTAYEGPFVGYYGANCFQQYVDEGRAEWPTSHEESERDLVAREAALEYIGDHTSRLPAVMAFRVGRMFDLYKPFQNTDLNVNVEGRGAWASRAGLWFFWATLAVGAVGLFRIWRDRLPVSPLLAPFGAVVLTAAGTFGVTRYRAPVDAVLAVLAAVGIGLVLGWTRRGSVRAKDEAVEVVRPEPPDVHEGDELVEYAPGD